jgi:sugar (pentulose or hexulose) kinase
MGDAILGLDIGTASTKAVLYDLSGAALAAAEQSYRLFTPQPGWAEQDPEALMQLLDVATGAWSEELCAPAGIEPRQLSPILPSGTVVGPVTPEVSRLTGLPAGALVVNGGHDQGCTALGLGVTAPGKVLLGCGTAFAALDAELAQTTPGAMASSACPEVEQGEPQGGKPPCSGWLCRGWRLGSPELARVGCVEGGG